MSNMEYWVGPNPRHKKELETTADIFILPIILQSGSVFGSVLFKAMSLLKLTTGNLFR